MLGISIGTTLTGAEILFLPYAQSSEEISQAFKGFSELDLFDAVMAMEYLILAAKRSKDIERGWEKALAKHLTYLMRRLNQKEILEFKIALDLSDAFKARDYGKHRVFEKYRTL